MKLVASEDGQVVLELSRREMETVYGCVVEAKEALREDEIRTRIGVGYDETRQLIDEMRTVMGWPSIEDMRRQLEPRFGRDGRGATAPAEPLPTAAGQRHLRQWSEDEAVLAQIGSALVSQVVRIEVSIPRELALVAAAAWERDDVGDPPLTNRRRSGERDNVRPARPSSVWRFRTADATRQPALSSSWMLCSSARRPGLRMSEI